MTYFRYNQVEEVRGTILVSHHRRGFWSASGGENAMVFQGIREWVVPVWIIHQGIGWDWVWSVWGVDAVEITLGYGRGWGWGLWDDRRRWGWGWGWGFDVWGSRWRGVIMLSSDFPIILENPNSSKPSLYWNSAGLDHIPWVVDRFARQRRLLVLSLMISFM